MQAPPTGQPLSRSLNDIGFDGVLSFETAPVLTSFPEAMKPTVLRFIRDIGEYISDELEKSL